MDVTFWELAWMFSTMPIFIFMAYWKGYNRGKREGWISGRSLMRIPMDVE